MKKERLDVLLVSQGYFASREKAKRAIMAGLVFVDNQISDKAGTNVAIDAEIYVKGDTCPFVSRGGLKLEKAIGSFHIDLENAVVMDIGASTGGFTDCMLQNGAAKVYSVDVGYGQLDWKLRNDTKVVNLEKTNIRYLDKGVIQEKLDFISIDVSFISLKLVLPIAVELLKETGSIICLVKPQFEAGREQVGKNGIVREPSIHKQVIANVISYGKENGLVYDALSFSPMTGAKGNIEYLLLFKKGKGEPDLDMIKEAEDAVIDQVVTEAHETLSK